MKDKFWKEITPSTGKLHFLIFAYILRDFSNLLGGGGGLADKESPKLRGGWGGEEVPFGLHVAGRQRVP
jgi:hypothetical protein